MNNDKKLLVECINFDLDDKVLTESIKNPNAPFTVTGILQRKGKKNQNGRIYPDEVLIREVDNYMKTLVAERRAVGELDHAESNVINLKNVSHNIIEMHWEGDDLLGTVEILTTPSGNILRELFKNKIKLGISSRGMGSLKKISESTSMVGDDYNLICWDFVSNPSTQGAFMYPSNNVQISEGINIVKNPIDNKWARVDDIIRNILTEIN